MIETTRIVQEIDLVEKLAAMRTDAAEVLTYVAGDFFDLTRPTVEHVFPMAKRLADAVHDLELVAVQAKKAGKSLRWTERKEVEFLDVATADHDPDEI